jgi:pilus assembly protein TadC
MENINFHVTSNDQSRITGIEIGGMLILENAQLIKSELLRILDTLSNQVKITISEPDELDISFIQLLVAFIRHMDRLKVSYQFDWMIDDNQRILLEHVGLGQEIFMHN